MISCKWNKFQINSDPKFSYLLAKFSYFFALCQTLPGRTHATPLCSYYRTGICIRKFVSHCDLYMQCVMSRAGLRSRPSRWSCVWSARQARLVLQTGPATFIKWRWEGRNVRWDITALYIQTVIYGANWSQERKNSYIVNIITMKFYVTWHVNPVFCRNAILISNHK